MPPDGGAFELPGVGLGEEVEICSAGRVRGARSPRPRKDAVVGEALPARVPEVVQEREPVPHEKDPLVDVRREVGTGWAEPDQHRGHARRQFPYRAEPQRDSRVRHDISES